MVELRLLGPFEARRDGRPVSLRPKQRALLAALALRPGEPVSLGRLVDDLWGERPPATATASLQNAVSLVRRTLGDGVVVTRPPGYALALEPDRIDAVRFERLVDEARRAPPGERARLLRDALALWRGPALADLGDVAFAAAETARLEELRASARENLAEAELRTGRHAELVPELEQLVAEEPFRERPRALLMLALYRAGRQADALEQYREARRFLLDELGVEPSPALRTLQGAILRQDPALDPADAAPLTRLPEEERRATVTVVFCDVVDSTGLGAALDAEAYRNVLRRYYRAARDVLERHGATVEKFVGDAVLGVFGVPERREDDALRAVRAASELHAEVGALNERLEREHAVAIRIRVGVNTGEVVVGEPDSGYSFATGHAVNVAAKLQQSAAAGETLLGAATLRLVRDAVRTEAAPPLALAARAAAVAAYRLVDVRGREGVARNLDAPLVGREGELAALRDAWARVREDARCRVVCLIGDAGIGKTRLARELLGAVEAEGAILFGRCVSYGEGATYLPVAEVLRQVAPDASEAGLAAAIGSAPDARRVALRLRQLTGLEEGAPPAGEGFWAFRRLLEELSRIRPVLLVLDDVHWAEPMLLDLVEHVEEQAADAPVLVLCLAREVRESWRERVLAELAPLSGDETGRLVANLADVPADLRERIVANAEGNALFAEQLVAHALEAGRAALDAVPETVEALLASRLDRLPAHERAVLERAAVVGREFWREAVAALADRNVGDALAALAARGLVRPVASQLPGEDAFRFHHVLIRDVAYGAITKERRSDLHRRAAEWLDGRGDGWDEIVGYHLEQSYALRTQLGAADDDARALAAAAADRLGAAGIRAWKRADAPAAANLLGRAVGLPGLDEARRAELLCELAQARRLSGDHEAADATLDEALEAARAAGARGVELRARLEQLDTDLVVRRAAACDDVLAEASAAIPILEELGAERPLARAWIVVGDVHLMRCRISAWGAARVAAFHYYLASGWSPTVAVEGIVAAAAVGETPVATALAECRELLAETDDLASEAAVRTWEAALEAMRGEFETAHALLDRALALDAQLGRARTSPRYVRAYALRLAGRLGEAAREQEGAYLLAERQGQPAQASSHAAELALLLAKLGRRRRAAAVGRRARGWAHPEDVQAAFLWRLVDAATAAAEGAHELAVELGTDALRLASTTDSVMYRAWVATEVARLQATAGRLAAAKRLLGEAEKLYREKGHLAGLRDVAASRADAVGASA